LLWVPGMTDYFFQEHVARRFHDLGYAFYAVDLRKCGRARQSGQRWHYSTDLAHYQPDLSAALGTVIDAGHPTLTPLAHSTGGLIVALWLDHLRRTAPVLHGRIGGLVLNSPWLDMQYPAWLTGLARPLLKLFGHKFPDLKLPGGKLGGYGASIHCSRHGEWDYDTRMKPLKGHPKYIIWLRTVLAGQARVHRGEVNVGVPALTLCSTTSYLGQPYSAASDTADAVLDVEQIQRWAPQLGEEMTVTPVDGARHDVFLSLPHAREEALTVTAEWLERQVPPLSPPQEN
ncbi:MAG TPA: alpha/beta hydrolase, partial [Corynebacterium sp.]|nr:alpha/beta hydrolase [Corynebacterium sp.]